MGNNNSIFSTCYTQDLPSTRNRIEECGFSSKGPIKATRKKCSIVTAETISIAPINLISNRSSVTEFIGNQTESTAECAIKTNKIKNRGYSVLSSPGRGRNFEPTEVFTRNSRKDGVNLVAEIRSKSLTCSPNSSVKSNFKPKEILNKHNFSPIILKDNCIKSPMDSLEDLKKYTNRSKKYPTYFKTLITDKKYKRK